MTVSLVVPCPTWWINANMKLHWAEKARAVKAWRDATQLQAKAAKLPKGLARVHITAFVCQQKGGRIRDAHNVYPSVKAALDGLIGDYGLLPDDSDRYLDGLTLQRGPTSEFPRGSLLLVIETVDSEGVAA